MGPKVSVIITTYNRDFQILKRSIDSVLNQTYQQIEIIVVNDTPNNSPRFSEVSEAIGCYGNKIIYIADGINRGACRARNYGFNFSTGEFVAFLDDDDEWLPTKIEKQLSMITSEECVMVTGFQNVITEQRSSTFKNAFKKLTRRFRRPTISLQRLLLKNVVGGCSLPLITREAFIKSGGFTSDLPSAQDYDLWIRLARLGKIICLKEPLINYYAHTSDRISSDCNKKVIAYKYLVERYQYIAKNKKAFLKNKYLIIAYNLYYQNKINEGNEYFRLANKIRTITLTSIYYNYLINRFIVKRIR